MSAAGSELALLRVLLVEENPGSACLILQVLCDSSRYEVTRAETSGEALAAVHARPFDIVLVDLGLSDSEGLATVREVVSAAPTIPIVVLTGLDDARLYLQAIRLGAQEYLMKGVIPPELIERSIQDAIERKRSTERLQHLNRVLAAIRSVNKRIARETDAPSLARAVCRTLVETGGYDAAMIALVDESGTPEFVAEHGWAGPRFDALTNSWRSGRPAPCSQCAPTSDTAVVVPSRCVRLDCPLVGTRGAALARLAHMDKPYGLLAVSFPGGLEPGEEDLRLIAEIADDVALGLNNLRVDAARESAEARYRALVESANVAIVIATEDAIVVEANREANAVFGNETLVGRNAFELVDPEHRELFVEKLREIRELGSVHLPDLLMRRADGAVRSVELSTSSIPVGGKRFLFAVFRDITEEKKLRSQVMASDRMASVGILAAGVAHEINNPLAVVVANLDYAIGDVRDCSPASQDLLEALSDGKSAAERVREIVKDMKLFSRAEDEARGPVDVERVLDSTVRMAGNEIRHRANLVKAYTKVPLVDANESRLGQVFLNLIVNAAQAIPEGSADQNEIRLSTSLDPSGRIVVEVRDSGPGIPPETLRRLFTPFFTTKPRGVGTGLGLAICLRIVNGLGGQISVESVVGRGTIFRIVLAPSDSVPTEPPPLPAVTPATRRGRILVLDDEPMVGAAVRRILGAEHEIETFTDGREALEKIRGGATYDVILCDLMMPVMTGMQFHDALSGVSTTAVERLVFLTGGAFTSVAQSFLDSTLRPCIEKPFDSLTLRSAVNSRCNPSGLGGNTLGKTSP